MPYYGGGIFCDNATIENCQILENSVVGQQGVGGGVFCRGTRIADCLIRDNYVSAGDGTCIAGGVIADYSTITHCVIENNWTRLIGNASGGGVVLYNSSMRDCILISNSAREGGGLDGSTSEVVNCVFIGNKAIGTGASPGRGAAIRNNGGPLTIVSCTCVGNISEHLNPQGSLVRVGGIYLPYGGSVQSTIVAFNDGAACGGNGTYSCTDLYGNTLGDAISGTDLGGNFSADPLFCSSDPVGLRNVTIHDDSPCAPGHHPLGTDCGLIGAGSIACGTISDVTRDNSRTFLGGAAPNPTSSMARFQVSIERRMMVKLGIYDVAGRLVIVLMQRPIEPGIHVVEWDGKNDRGREVNAGVYIATLQAAKRVLTQKIVRTR